MELNQARGTIGLNRAKHSSVAASRGTMDAMRAPWDMSHQRYAICQFACMLEHSRDCRHCRAHVCYYYTNYHHEAGRYRRGLIFAAMSHEEYKKAHLSLSSRVKNTRRHIFRCHDPGRIHEGPSLAAMSRVEYEKTMMLYYLCY